MKIEIYKHLHNDAIKVRTFVFVREQGFINEIDDIDDVATHFVVYNDNVPIGTCRVFLKDGKFILGRLAVLKEWRQKGIGSLILNKAESYVVECGGSFISLHSQAQAIPFYEKCGYYTFGDIEYEEDCPHIWMIKNLI